MKSTTSAEERSVWRKICSAWELISLGFCLGVGATFIYFRPDIEAASRYREISSVLVGLFILMFAAIPSFIFRIIEAIGAVRTWQHIRKRNAELGVAPNRSLLPSQRSTSPVRGPEDI